ncbi:hypothetical protein D3C72_1738980 [compost metagenome]
MPRRLRRDHDHVEVLARHHLSVVDIEAVGEGQHRAGTHHRRHRLAVDLADGLVRDQQHDDVRLRRRLRHRRHLQSRDGGLAP